MSRKRKEVDPPCPHCGCPEVNTFIRQSSKGIYAVTSCPGCDSINGEPPKKPRAKKAGAR